MNTVFKFTFIQQIKTKSYRVVTLVIAFLLILLSAGTLTLIEVIDKDEVMSDVDYVFVTDKSFLSGVDYNVLNKSGNKNFEKVSFVTASSDDIVKAADEAKSKSDHSLAMEVSGDQKNGIKVRVVSPEKFAGSKDSADNIADYVKDNLKYALFEKAGLTDIEVNELTVTTDTKSAVIGKESSESESLIKMIMPVAAGFILYMMLAIYGQNVARGIVLEKDSKIIETLLVIVKPYDIIFGKLLAICLYAIIQMTIWILSLFAGLGAGYLISSSINQSGRSTGEKLFELIGKLSDSGAFSISSVILAVVAIVTGFILFCSLAALFGSFASKTEEVPVYFGFYTMIMVVGWMFPYINGLSGNEKLLSILRYIPFTSPFTIPADILIGNMTLSEGMISSAIMIFTTILLVAAAAKVYNALVLYRGATLKPKDIAAILKNSGHSK